ncbi:Thiamine monophosphate synthase [hydrothermal vent metagenome]|uniref:Thiamine monophosphate synthase n=1 Tax=hydrothermal vent metagenome TaxID=652676 RepID=A0A1W1C3U4_9ZZZZ
MIYYAISDPSTLNFDNLNSDLKRFAKKADIITYRDKTNKNYHTYAEIFIERAKEYSFDKVLLHSDFRLAHRLKADGVHLTSSQSCDIGSAKSLELFVIISCHTIDEAVTAESLGADMVTFSPIFTTPNKGEPIGVEAITKLKSIISIPIIALGGVTTMKQIDACRLSGASGFASIRFFK